MSKRRWVCRCPKAILAFGTNPAFLLTEQKYQFHPCKRGKSVKILKTNFKTFSTLCLPFHLLQFLSSSSEYQLSQHMEKPKYFNKNILIWYILNMNRIWEFFCVWKLYTFEQTPVDLDLTEIRESFVFCASKLSLVVCPQFCYNSKQKSRIWSATAFFLKGEKGPLISYLFIEMLCSLHTYFLISYIL